MTETWLKLAEAEDLTESMRLFSHLIFSQDRWQRRVLGELQDQGNWFSESYSYTDCIKEWTRSKSWWLEFTKKEQDLYRPVYYDDSNGGRYSSTIGEIGLQLNLHVVHHRAQIYNDLRRMSLEPPLTDYVLWTRMPESK